MVMQVFMSTKPEAVFVINYLARYPSSILFGCGVLLLCIVLALESGHCNAQENCKAQGVAWSNKLCIESNGSK